MSINSEIVSAEDTETDEEKQQLLHLHKPIDQGLYRPSLIPTCGSLIPTH